jgi:predicted TIM-barrel fold metal-dependent hydrolase
VFQTCRRDIARVAANPNVFMKLGGMAMPINGYGWHWDTAPPSSEAFVAAQGDYYRAAIDLFSPARCMFESNFPVDKPCPTPPCGTPSNASPRRSRSAKKTRHSAPAPPSSIA